MEGNPTGLKSGDEEQPDSSPQQSGMSYEQFMKYKRFQAWCAENGVVGPKVHYPARFSNGLVGMKCL